MLTKLQKYARLAVRSGVNVQPDQVVFINSPVDCAPLARLLVEEAYAVKAKEVVVNWIDELTSKQHYLYCVEDVMTDIKPWFIGRLQEVVDKKACVISISAPIPGLMADVDPKKISAVAQATQKATVFFSRYLSANEGQWSIVAMPTLAWAVKVFPDASEEEAMAKLWDAIFFACHVRDDNDPIVEWNAHMESMAKRNAVLNSYDLDRLHFTNALGTDLTIQLVDNHIWSGGGEHSASNVYFAPNIPTEESFTMPHKFGVDGIVYSTKPLNYQGKLIDHFWLKFKDGKVVEFDAQQEKAALEALIQFDEGSSYLGEVALVPFHSPISDSNILFLNTLFDENASCHLALGRAYPMNIKGGTAMSEEELKQANVNSSLTHVDFMFGDATMQIVGYAKDGKEVIIFKDGDFAF